MHTKLPDRLVEGLTGGATATPWSIRARACVDVWPCRSHVGSSAQTYAMARLKSEYLGCGGAEVGRPHTHGRCVCRPCARSGMVAMTALQILHSARTRHTRSSCPPHPDHFLAVTPLWRVASICRRLLLALLSAPSCSLLPPQMFLTVRPPQSGSYDRYSRDRRCRFIKVVTP